LDKAITGVFGLNDGDAGPNLAELSPHTIFKLVVAVADAMELSFANSQLWCGVSLRPRKNRDLGANSLEISKGKLAVGI
jgi:hypothetical protein